MFSPLFSGDLLFLDVHIARLSILCFTSYYHMASSLIFVLSRCSLFSKKADPVSYIKLRINIPIMSLGCGSERPVLTRQQIMSMSRQHVITLTVNVAGI